MEAPAQKTVLVWIGRTRPKESMAREYVGPVELQRAEESGRGTDQQPEVAHARY